MITEDYVSFETAKLLKEKGFDIPCMGRYSVRSKEFHLDCTKRCNNGGLFECAAPTLQMAMKWLREVHNLWLEISPEGKGLWYMEVYSLTDEAYIPNSNGHKIKSYEEACEAAIKYCLENLVKITK